MKKRITTFLLSIIISLQIIPSVYAYEFPSSFWEANSKYDTAVKSGDDYNVIEYGERIIELLSSEPNVKEVQDNIVIKSKAVGKAYAYLKDYDNAAKTFSRLYSYTSEIDKYWEYAKDAKARVNQYTSDVSVYTDNGSYTYYGAKNEKKNGVLFGVCSTSKTRNKLKNESMTLVYQELGQDLVTYNESIFDQAVKSDMAVEYALNCPKEGKDIKNIKNLTSNLKEISNMLKKYPDVPVYLRFAAEFDIWSDLTDADSFKSAYRYVSDYFKSRNSNVAMVWSPNQVSNWNINIDDFYPGDSYVDWVGMSLYAGKYFLGDKSSSGDNNLLFKSGINSDPVIAVKDIIEKYGDRKPIIISECGCGHKMVKSGEDTSSFGIMRLKQYLNYLPMVYPQIKAIAYFDAFVESGSEKNDYRLTTNSNMQKEFINTTKGMRYIQDGYSNNTDFCYRKISNGTVVDGIFPVYCYAHRYNADIKKVTYFVDGKYVGMSTEIPYSTYIDAGGYSGTHKLKTVVLFSDDSILTSESNVKINEANTDVKVKISGKRIYFDQEPVIYNDRTMVPMRKIFEELGADVSWDSSTKTASGTRGDRTVEISVGSNKMYVNNKEITLDAPSFILADRTLVPVRAIAEGMGCDVDWISSSNTVTIEPKEFEWSEWMEDLPSFVDEDLYYIERKSQYRSRTREKEYYTLEYEDDEGSFVEKNTSYGSWSEWRTDYIQSSDVRQVETRTQNIDDSVITEYRYRMIYYEYTYWRWGDWSKWSKWEDGMKPFDKDGKEYEGRTMYRYKEK